MPREDRAQFKKWADDLVTSIAFHSSEAVSKRDAASKALAEYISGLVKLPPPQPGDDMLSRLANDRGPDGFLDERYLAATGTLLLVAGHETTVNLIANGMLTLLRHPDILERLRHEPDLVIGTVEELLRYEPPVQFLANRTTLQEIRIGDITIPKGVLVTMALAAGNRDPDRFGDPDRFDPEPPGQRPPRVGSGIHSASRAARRGSRRRSRCSSWRGAWCGRGCSRIRRRTARVRCCGGRRSCGSRSRE